MRHARCIHPAAFGLTHPRAGGAPNGDHPSRSAALRGGAGRVTFEPGARTAWHTYPLGQHLIVVDGVGRVKREGGPVDEVRPGDVVWFLPHEKHWHGASPTTAMTHIAIQEALDGRAVEWLEKVSDEQYRAGERQRQVEG